MAKSRKSGDEKPGKLPDEMTSVGLTVGTRDRLAAYCERRLNMTFKDVLAAVVNWFLNQPPAVQGVVLGEAENMPAAYAAALRQLADDIERGSGPTRPPGGPSRGN
jgi:hypothetical protein